MHCILSAVLVKSAVGERPGVIPRSAEVGVGEALKVSVWAPRLHTTLSEMEDS